MPIYASGSAATIEVSGSNNSILFGVHSDSSASILTVTGSGRVGISTATPNEKLSIAPDTDVSAEIGKAHVGYMGTADYAGFSHVDQDGSTTYALQHDNDGVTYLNSGGGLSPQINFRINNSTKAVLNSSHISSSIPVSASSFWADGIEVGTGGSSGVTSIGLTGSDGVGIASINTLPISGSDQITFSLGDITPTSISSSGPVTASHFSGDGSGLSNLPDSYYTPIDSYTTVLWHFDDVYNKPNPASGLGGQVLIDRIINSGIGGEYTINHTNIDTGNIGLHGGYSTASYFGSNGLKIGWEDRLNITASAQMVDDFDFGSGDFTIDFWLRPEPINDWWGASGYEPAGFFRTDSWWMGLWLTGQYAGAWDNPSQTARTIAFRFNDQPADTFCFNWPASSSNGPTDYSVWNHWAFVRNGSNFDLYINGYACTKGANSTQTALTSAISQLTASLTGLGFQIGGMDGFPGQHPKSIYDEFRISKGIARWTEEFPTNLPARAYTSVQGFRSAQADYGVTGSHYSSIYYKAGKVGIGTHLPAANLEISGSDNSELLNVRSSSSANILNISGSGLISLSGTLSSSAAISASSFWVNGVALTGGAGGSGTITALNNQAESRLVTIGSTTTELDGEANLTYDGTTFQVSGSNNSTLLNIKSDSSSNIVTVTGSGRVGLGTATPSASVHINFPVTESAFRVDTMAPTESATIPTFIVSGSGDIGIGTAAPSARLEVSGSNNSSLLNIKSSSNAKIFEISGSSSTTTHVSASVPISASSFWLNGVALTTGGGGNLTDKGDLEVYTTSQGRLGSGSNGQVLTIDSTAASGLAWAAAGVAGSYAHTSSAIAPVTPTTGDWWYDHTNNILYNRVTDAAATAAWVDVSTATSTLVIKDADSDTKIQTEESADEDKIRFDTAGTERMIIDQTGSIGIGTSSPTYKLDVSGTISGSSFYGDGSNLTGISSASGTVTLLGLTGSSGITIASTNTLPITGSDQVTFSLGAITPTSVSASANISASYFFGDGSILQGVTGSGGTVTLVGLTGSNGVTITSVNALPITGSDQVTITLGAITPTSVSASANISASSYYGDGSNLTGVTGSGGTVTLIGFTGSSGVTITSTNTLPITGSDQVTLTLGAITPTSVSASSFISASSFHGDGSNLQGVTGSAGVATAFLSASAGGTTLTSSATAKILNFVGGTDIGLAGTAATNTITISYTGSATYTHTSSAIAPGSPDTGDWWYDHTNNILYNRVTDAAATTAWVDVSTATSTLVIKDADSDTKIQTEESADEDKIRFDTAGTERMIIDQTGSVGIGTTTPTYKLDVNGTISGSSFYGDGSNLTGISSASGTVTLIGLTGSNGVTVTSTNTLPITGSDQVTITLGALTPTSVSASANISASSFYGDGSILQGVTGSGGTVTLIGLTGSNGVTITSTNALPISGSDQVTVTLGAITPTSVSASSTISASSFWGDGSNLTGIDVGDAISFDGSTANGVLTYKDADEATVESNLTFDGSVLTIAGGISASGDLYGANLYISASGENVIQVSNSGATLSKWEWHRNSARKWVIYNDGRSSPSLVEDGLHFKSGISSDADATNLAMVLKPDQGAKFYGDVTASGDLYLEGSVGIGTNAPNSSLEISGSDNTSLLNIKSNSNANILFVTGSGRVGIGTATPSQHFSVKGANSEFVIYENANDDVRIGTWTDDDISFIVNGSRKATIDGDGKVGIGTSAPGPHKLTIVNTQTDNINSGSLGFFPGGGATYAYNSIRQSATPLADLCFDRNYGGSDSESMRIQRSTGYVGIRTATPSSSLEISGSDNTSLLNIKSDTFSGSILTVSGSGKVGIRTATPLYDLDLEGHIAGGGYQNTPSYIRFGTDNDVDDISGGILWKSAYSGYSKISAQILGICEGNYARQGLAFYTGNNTDATTNASERLRIDMDGNVGIGETSVDALLHITKGSAGLSNVKMESVGSAAMRFGIPAGSTNFVFDNANDDLSSPKVVIGAAGTVQISSSAARLEVTGSDNSILFGVHSTTNANILTVTGSGRVGIGTSTPGVALHVYNATGDNGITIENDADDAILVIDAGGTDEYSYVQLKHAGTSYWNVGSDAGNSNNFYIYSGQKTGGGDRVFSITKDGYVGIGTTSPSQELTVAGNVSASLGITASAFYGDGSNLQGVTGSGGGGGGTTVSSSYNGYVGVYTGSSAAYTQGITGSSGLFWDGDNSRLGIGTTSPKVALDYHFDPTGLSDDTGGGEVIKIGSGTTVAGKLYYLGTGSAWDLVDADSVLSGSDQLLGLALGTTPGTHGMLVRGFFDAATYLSNFSAGKAVYIDRTSGSMNTTAPSGSGEFVRVVGYCTSTANVINFSPSEDWIELGDPGAAGGQWADALTTGASLNGVASFSSSATAPSATSGYSKIYASGSASASKLYIQNASGSAIDVGRTTAKAWCNIDGENATPAVRDSHNVSSITDRATGKLTVNFTVAMANDDYAVFAKSHSPSTSGTLSLATAFTLATGSVLIENRYTHDVTWRDADFYVVIFGG